METLKFETSVGAPSQLEKLSHYLDEVPSVVDWCMDYFSNHFLLSLKGINIKALDIIKALESLGIDATQVYEE
ncbi:hypothetical protein GCM10007415_12760 [Parapedobacter pyrenivorans]|uniref:Uncharacterized protein n=1 Tax=Parapedobacter pyrenivorans TaxID=1305674 RepID=A0A917HJX3_9SPHI|nr:hypothetical protein [Parapedobacter pyrenivorans]GGG81541.1 hypothetical protein GCM10007415_12760 [Parapedobacter pyrenivorans]